MFVVITNIYSTNDKTFIPNYVFSVVGVTIKKCLQCPMFVTLLAAEWPHVDPGGPVESEIVDLFSFPSNEL